jgi:hypothetical protein
MCVEWGIRLGFSAGGLAEAAASEDQLTGEPRGIPRRQEDRDGGNIAGLTDASQRGLGDRSRLEARAEKAGTVRAFGLDHAGIQRIDADLLRTELAGKHAGDGVRPVMKPRRSGNHLT